jgi:hypothetical protein
MPGGLHAERRLLYADGAQPAVGNPETPTRGKPAESLPAPKGHVTSWRAQRIRRSAGAHPARYRRGPSVQRVRSNAGTCRHGAPSLPKMVHLSFSTDPVEV